MAELIPLVAIICIFVILPGMAMYFADRRRRWQADDAARAGTSTAELLALAEKMERRIDALEQILDAESPGWRKKYHEHS
ncbi:envelope stress response membrane protein PspB [Sinimarinibacterium thermocellulolyticum]|uniref:Envelope stress response membrane protein PspB n=1 Tax=Sinimarinibacterium thermocellulolyticum TaxID=3170016 RepID=A0ABV2AAH9_9GAMM